MGATGGLDDFETEKLCTTLYHQSLLLTFDLTARIVRLHDVFRSYLQKAVYDVLPAIHEQLLDTYKLIRWADLPGADPYLWDHLDWHLVAAGRLAELISTVKDLRYLARKTRLRSAYAIEHDIAFAEKQAPGDVQLRLLKRNFANMCHLLNRCITYQ